MTLLRVLATLALCLMLQAGLGRLAPSAHHYIDLMLIPVIFYAVTGSQRSAMLVGCAAGLLQDAWLHVGVFGLNGFKKTLLGWFLGGLGSRFDLNQQHGRFFGGVVLSLADSLLDLGLRRLLDQQTPTPQPLMLLGKAILTGLLVAVAFVIVDRVGTRERFRRRLARRV